MEYNSSAKICTTYDNYEFSKIVLTDPELLHGGSFFTKLNVDNSMFYIQTPKCISKQGIILTAGKKSYIDLMFSNEHSEFIGFIENLEKACIEKIYTKRNSWFTNDIDQSDIENAFTSALRSFKSGKYYLLRANIASSKNMLKMPTCFVFDENEKQLTLEDIKQEEDMITVLEIQGIKFTSKSFQFEIVMRQVLILSDKPVFQECVIKRSQTTSIQNNTNPTSIVASSMVSQNPIIPDELQNNNVNITISSETKVEEHDNVKPVPATPIMVSLVTKCLDIDVEKDIEKDKEVKMIDEKGNRNGNEQLATQSNNINKQGTLEKDSLKQKISDFPDMMELTDADLEIKNDESVKIKPANDIYYELYRVAKEKARTARKLAFDAYLEVKKIKKTYMLDDSDSDFSNSSESEKSEDSDDSQESEDE
jgi:23S rRNA pseudoU1915 N3-methylase RlmH